MTQATDPLAEYAPTPKQNRRVSMVLWLLGLPGLLSLPKSVLPQWLPHSHDSAQLPLAHWLTMGALALLLAVSVSVGQRLGSYVGLSAPLLHIGLSGRSPWRAIRFLSLPGIAGGVAGAAWLVTLAVLWPESLSVVDPVYAMPLLPKLLYGGITEELLLRYGGLSLVMWLLWRLTGDSQRRPGWRLGWFAVIVTALIVGSLPLLMSWSLLGSMTTGVLVQLLLCDIVYGVMAGFIFWRYGIEAAILAHVISYLLSHGLV
ncbi:MAG: abortive infection protein [Comamonas sp.]|uniref:abortive infection protein n=1 Tax=Comamonas sp. TaxID=34028 RepID=UPI003054E7AB